MFYTLDVKDNTMIHITTKPEQEKSYPLMLLVNQNIASASEVIAGVFKNKAINFLEKNIWKSLIKAQLLSQRHFRENLVLNLTNGYWLLTESETVAGGLIPVFLFLI